MIAIDTNIIVRFIVKDDPDQFARVRALLAANPVYVCKTVVLECEWVLRSAYRLPRTEIRNALGCGEDLTIGDSQLRLRVIQG